MASKQKRVNVSLTHFGFTSKKVALRDEEEPKDDAGTASTVARTEDPLPPSGSPEEEQREVEASCAPKTQRGLRKL